MGIADSPDIFQEKMLELMESLEFVRAYLDDLLCISKLSLEDNIDKLEVVLRRLRDAGLKVNAAKSTFCALEIEYLGYVLTRDGIKPQSNKVSGNTHDKTAHRSKTATALPRHGAILP